MSNKLWLCGQCPGIGELNNLLDIVKISSYFDGLCWCVNYKHEDFSDDDGTYELLFKNKGKGKILRANWVQLHNIGMNIAIHSGPPRHSNWICLLDSQETLKEEFLKNLRYNIKNWENDNINTITWNGRPYIFKFYEWQTIEPTSAHCLLHPIYSKILDIKQEDKVVYHDNYVEFGDFLINKKKFENTRLLSGVKYSLYKVSNQLQMFYKGNEYQQHEWARRSFCQLLESKNYSRTLEGLESFFKNKDNITNDIKKYLQFEWVFADFYKYKILGLTLDEVLKNRQIKLNEEDFEK